MHTVALTQILSEFNFDFGYLGEFVSMGLYLLSADWAFPCIYNTTAAIVIKKSF